MLDTEKVIEWFKSNMRTHSDWTGTHVEYGVKCESVDEFINTFLNDVKR